MQDLYKYLADGFKIWLYPPIFGGGGGGEACLIPFLVILSYKLKQIITRYQFLEVRGLILSNVKLDSTWFNAPLLNFISYTLNNVQNPWWSKPKWYLISLLATILKIISFFFN